MAKVIDAFWLLFTLLLLSIHSSSSSSSNPSQNPNPNLNSAHDELKSKGFPIGLLPTNVLNYSLNRTSGDFSVNLDDICRITLPPDNYLAAYSRRVTGKLVEGKISELDGIQVRAFFKWWSITGIRMSGENLVFEVGMVTAKYPSNNFDDSLECEGRHSSS